MVERGRCPNENRRRKTTRRSPRLAAFTSVYARRRNPGFASEGLLGRSDHSLPVVSRPGRPSVQPARRAIHPRPRGGDRLGIDARRLARGPRRRRRGGRCHYIERGGKKWLIPSLSTACPPTNDRN